MRTRAGNEQDVNKSLDLLRKTMLGRIALADPNDEQGTAAGHQQRVAAISEAFAPLAGKMYEATGPTGNEARRRRDELRDTLLQHLSTVLNDRDTVGPSAAIVDMASKWLVLAGSTGSAGPRPPDPLLQRQGPAPRLAELRRIEP